MRNVENYSVACKWMESQNEEIEKIAKGAGSPEDNRRSQQLAVILLFTRQYASHVMNSHSFVRKMMEATLKWEKKCHDCEV